MNISFQKRKDAETSIFEINRSLKFLDETFRSPHSDVGSPHIPRMQGTPGGLLQRSRITLDAASRNRFDTSLTLQPNELDFFRRKNLDSVDLTSFSLAVPWRTVCDRLFTDFLEAMNYESMGHCLTECVPRFLKSCEETLSELKRDTAKMSAEASVLNLSHVPENVSVEDTIIAKLWLQGEYNIWCLLYSLYRDRLETEEEKMSPLPLASEAYVSEKMIVENLYRTDSYVRECQIVIDWLEKTALEQNISSVRMRHFTDKTIAWENTLHQLQRRMENIPYSSSSVLVTKLDPDAPRRESRNLHDLDKEDEDRLMRDVFLEVRCGRLDQAQDLLAHCGQHLKAVALEGWKPYHDPNYASPAPGGKLPVAGVFNRDVWKLCALRLAQDKKVGAHERATFAAFCGHLPALAEVCRSWEDLLWASLRVQVDIRVEEEIRQVSARDYVALPEEYWQNKTGLEELFAELEASKERAVAEEARDPVHTMQKLLILDDIPQLLDHLERWVDEDAPLLESCCGPHFLRCAAHVVLFLRSVRRCDDKHGNRVLEAYVRVLMEKQEPRLVAYYVSALPPDLQVELYASFLRNVVDPEDRRLCLELADNAGLDVDVIAKTVVENIRRSEDDAGTPQLQAELTRLDLEKISALDWLTFYPEQRLEAMWQANAVIRYFLAAGKTRAARLAFNKLPENSVETIMRQFQVDETTPIPPRVSSTIREYLCIDVYLNAEEGFTEWYQLFHNGRPQEPARPPGEVTFTRQVAYEHLRNNYETELELWKMTMAQQTKTVKTLLYNVLMFPNGGWMVDEEPWSEWGEGDLEELKNREQQMNSLRQLYIHKVILLLLCVMHNMKEDSECIKMSVTIASEYHQLYKVFTKQQLRELRLKICDSSLSVLDEGCDSWGFPSTS
ncbi:nuclear pore complex protein Nup107 [Bacillus rossius redtenbacheri]|uniref:nuclear pore complex protein Nup107 n=1 Tax=Bacillus rossius redtenbacheri TaxID=93214 RepID=UPI002FDD3308